MFMILADRAFSAKEVHDLSIWSLNEFGIGIQLMSFELDIWNTVAPGTVYWTPPSSMLPMTEFTVSFALQINSDSFNERNIFQIDSPLSHFAVNIKAGVNQLSLSISDKSNVMTKDCSGFTADAHHNNCQSNQLGSLLRRIHHNHHRQLCRWRARFVYSVISVKIPASVFSNFLWIFGSKHAMFGYTMSSNEALLPRIMSVCPRVFLSLHLLSLLAYMEAISTWRCHVQYLSAAIQPFLQFV